MIYSDACHRIFRWIVIHLSLIYTCDRCRRLLTHPTMEKNHVWFHVAQSSLVV